MEAKGRNESALRMRSAAGQVFRYAIAQGLIENDPTFGLKDALTRAPVKHRSALINPEQVGGLMRAIEGFDGQPTTRIALQLLAMTALRPGELRMAEWAEIDLEKRFGRSRLIAPKCAARTWCPWRQRRWAS
jgi:integrase